MNTVDIQIGLKEKFDDLIPSTLEGNKIYEKYTKIFESEGGQKFPISHYTNLINESINSKDQNLNNWGKEIQKTIMENHMNVWNFSLLLEGWEESNSAIYEKVIDDLKYLKHYDNQMFEHCVKNGALNEYLNFKNIKAFNESVNHISYTKRLNESNIQYNPVSYYELINNEFHFMLESKCFKYSKTEGLVETQVPNQTFADVNAAVQQVPYNVDKDEYDMTYLVGNVNVTSKGKIFLDKEPIELDILQRKVSESIKDLPYNKQIIESRRFDTLSLLIENWHKLVKLDNIHAIKNTVNESVVFLCEHENGMKYLIDKTGIFKTTESISESLQEIKKYMGIDISESFIEDIQHERNVNVGISNVKQLIEAEIQKYENKIAEIKTEMGFMIEGSTKWNEAEELIKLCEDGKSALMLSEGKGFPTKDEIHKYAIKRGNNPKDAMDCINKEYDYVKSTYKDITSPSKAWEIIHTLY